MSAKRGGVISGSSTPVIYSRRYSSTTESQKSGASTPVYFGSYASTASGTATPRERLPPETSNKISVQSTSTRTSWPTLVLVKEGHRRIRCRKSPPRGSASHPVRVDNSTVTGQVERKQVLRVCQSSLSESARSTAAGTSSTVDEDLITPLSATATEAATTDTGGESSNRPSLTAQVGIGSPISSSPRLEDCVSSPSAPRQEKHLQSRTQLMALLAEAQAGLCGSDDVEVQPKDREQLQRLRAMLKADMDMVDSLLNDQEVDAYLQSSPTPAVSSEAPPNPRRPRAQAPNIARSLSASSQDGRRREEPAAVVDARKVMVQPPRGHGAVGSRAAKILPVRGERAASPQEREREQRRAAREALERAVEHFEAAVGSTQSSGAWHDEAAQVVPVARAWASRASTPKCPAPSATPPAVLSPCPAVEAALETPQVVMQRVSTSPLHRRRGVQPGQCAYITGRTAVGAATAGGTVAPRGGRHGVHRSLSPQPVHSTFATTTSSLDATASGSLRVPPGIRPAGDGSSPTKRLRSIASDANVGLSRGAARAPVRTSPINSGSLFPMLRDAYIGAQAAGLSTTEDELVARAKALLSEHDAQEDAARKELREALAHSRRLVESRFGNMRCLKEAKERLSSALLNARHLGVLETDLREAESRRRRLHNMMEDLKGQIRVFCRIRPLSQKELQQADFEVLQSHDGLSLEVPQVGSFSYDGVFLPGTQEEVFEDCRDLVQSAVDGHNVTIFAYGQTGAGKTHTMYGSPDQEGIAPRAIDELFQIIDSINTRYSVTVSGSMVELYNNQLVDLLRPVPRRGSMPGNANPKLSLRQDRAGLVQVQEMKELEVKDAAQLKALLDRGIAQRTVAANTMNIESSRSHLIFTIRVTCVSHETQDTLKGKILLCDLGGSERLKKTEATGDQKKEAIEINKSLSALGDVIEAVAKKQKQVPYRNHKLTQIMQDSLGGTAKTLMFVNCSPAQSSLDETTMSLKYAARVKRVTNWASPSHSPTRTSHTVDNSPLQAVREASPYSPSRGRTSGSMSVPVSRCSSATRRGGVGVQDDFVITCQHVSRPHSPFER